MKLSIKELATLTGARVEGDENLLISGINDIEVASGEEATFLENQKYGSHLKETKAGVIFLHPGQPRPAGKNYLLIEKPSLAFQKAIEAFIPKTKSGFPAIHPTAVIHPETKIGSDVTVGPYAVIEQGAIIGNGTHVGAHVFIGVEAIIGDDCHFHPHAVIRERCQIGKRVILQPGAVIGSSGFGYATDEKGVHHPLEQLGIVVLEDDVEIGANTTIDRARFKETRICHGTKIDNLVQIAHQVKVGSDSLIVSQVGIAGSTTIGNHAIIGGQAGIIGHIEITDNVILAARATPIKSIKESGIYSGTPAIPIREFNEQMVYIRNLKKLVDRVKKLEEKLNGIEEERPSSSEG